MKKQVVLMVGLLIGTLLYVCSTGIARTEVGPVTYELTNVDEHLLHVKMVIEEELEPEKMSIVPFYFSSADEIANVKAYDLTENTELKAEVAKLMGHPGIKVYVSPILFPGRHFHYKYEDAFEKKKVVDVKLQVEADIKDRASFYQEGDELIFHRATGWKEAIVVLPQNYAVIYSNHPVLIRQKESNPSTIEVRISNPYKEGGLEIFIKAKKVWEAV